jgi:hypothetical protein
VKSNGFAPPGPPGNRGRSSATPARPSGAAPEGLPGYRAFFVGTRIEEAHHVGAGAAPPPNPPPRPASGSHRLPNTLCQVGEQYGPSIAPFARARCPFSPLPRPYSPGGAARGSHTGHGPIFVFRVSYLAVASYHPYWTYPTGFGR